jgi:hypothetical protein
MCIELPTIKNNTQQHIYNVLEPKQDNDLTCAETLLAEHDSQPASPANNAKIYDYSTGEDLHNSDSKPYKMNPIKPNRKSIHDYINIDIPITEVSDTSY